MLVGFSVFQITNVPDQAAEIERIYVSEVSSFSEIVDNPLSLPHKLSSFAATFVSDSVRAVRAVSVVLFAICVVALYRILKRWHSDMIALFCSAMFAVNASALAVGRLASPLVLLFGWSLIISTLLWIQHGNSRRIAPVTVLLLSALLIYVPGAPYFFLLLLILFGSKLKDTLKSLTRNALILGGLLGAVLVAPLIYSFVGNPDLIRVWLLLPETFSITETLRNILEVPSAFVYRTEENPLLNVGRLPVLDVAIGGFFLIGLYAYQRYKTLERTRVMLLTSLLGLLLGALGQVTIAVVLLLPFVYAVSAAGISYILDEWFRVFPRNPFARSFGIMLITVVVLASMYYQMTRFLVVWPQTPETREVYSQSLIVE